MPRGGEPTASLAIKGPRVFDPWSRYQLALSENARLAKSTSCPLSGSLEAPPLQRYSLPQFGDDVQIVGSTSRPELNGAVGRVAGRALDARGGVVLCLLLQGEDDGEGESGLQEYYVKVHVSKLRRLAPQATSSVPVLPPLSSFTPKLEPSTAPKKLPPVPGGRRGVVDS